MTKKTKLELNWPGKDERPKLEPRILIQDAEKSYQSEGLGGREGLGTFDNTLIRGDNLLALKALESDYAGRIKCIYIDPPFNTGSAFEHYEDGVEHSLWLSLMRIRFYYLHSLLADDGVIFVHLDHNEAAYCKVLLDEVFGRTNYMNTITTKTNDASGFKATGQSIFSTANQIHLYAKKKEMVALNKIFIEKGYDTGYSEFVENVEEPFENWRFSNVQTQIARLNNFSSTREAKKAMGREFDEQMAKFAVDNADRVFQAVAIGGGAALKRASTIAQSKEDRGKVYVHPGDEGERFFILNGRQIVFYVDRLENIDGAMVPGQLLTDIWTDISWNGIANEGGVDFKNGKKPEAIVRRVLQLASGPGDIILDSFAGSGTTGAVAQKMGRRWIMVEIGDHADTHIIPRLKKVIEGTDQGGVSKAMEWQGGGGFRYYTLAPSMLSKDKWGNWVVAKEYDPNMLAAAMCKHLGFTYAPAEDESEWWRHGQSSETDFIYVTTQSLTHDALKLLSDEVGEGRSLMICAPAFSGSFDDFENLSCTKIPSAVLSRCEWGRDDYSLNVSEAPADETVEADEAEDADA